MRSQKGFAWLCAALLAFTVQAHAQSTKPAPAKVELDVMGELTIDPQGAVSAFSAAPSVPAPVAKIVQDAVKHWRFEPVLQDGKPVEKNTQMFLFLTGEPGEGGYRLRVERVQFGFTRGIRDFKARAVPKEAMAQRIGAEVLVAVQIDSAGNVLDASPLRSRLVPGVRNERVAKKLRASFENTVVSSMKQSKFEPADPAQGSAATAMITNMSFSMTGQPNVAAIWTQADAAVTSTGIPGWLHGSMQDGTLDRVRDGHQIAIDGGPKLQTDVVGKLL